MRKRINKLLAKFGFAYCRECGEELWFDDEKWNLGYNVHSVCLRCKEKR